MSIESVSWALRVPVGGNCKIMLMGLANHAHPDGTESYPSLDTLASYGHCDRSTARRNVRKLVELGWIREDGLGPKGQSKYALAMTDEPRFLGGGNVPPVAPEPSGGGNGGPEGVAPVPPEPSKETSKEPSTSGAGAGERGTQHRLPDDLPESLHQTTLQAARTLYRAAQFRKQRRPVMLEAVGRAVAAQPTKDHLAVAQRVEHWVCWGNGQGKPCKDIVARFRDWLPDSEDVRLPDGVLIATPGAAAPSGNVRPIGQGRRLSNSEQVDAQVQALRQMGSGGVHV